MGPLSGPVRRIPNRRSITGLFGYPTRIISTVHNYVSATSYFVNRVVDAGRQAGTGATVRSYVYASRWGSRWNNSRHIISSISNDVDSPYCPSNGSSGYERNYSRTNGNHTLDRGEPLTVWTEAGHDLTDVRNLARDGCK